MEKRKITILVSTILCAVATISLGIYTLVDALSSKKTPGVDNDPVSNVSVVENVEKSVNLLVGDEYGDNILSESNYTGTLLKCSEDGKFVASTAGHETIKVEQNEIVYNYAFNIFEVGNGSKENPYNIIRATDLIELVQDSLEYTYYVQQCDLDLSENGNWIPLGSMTMPFVGSYDGNGYKIVNMKQTLTLENIDNYVDYAMTKAGKNGSMLCTGLFGFVGDVYGDKISELKNISIIDAKIDTTELQNNRADIELTQSYVAVLAGYTTNTTITGSNSLVSSKIVSGLNCDSTNSTYGAVSGLIGGATSCEISGMHVVANITNSNVGTYDSNGNPFGTNFAGILGRDNKTPIHDCQVELSVVTKNFENTVIAGVVDNVIKQSGDVIDFEIKNIQVDNFYAKVSRYNNFSNSCALVSGAVSYNNDENVTLENISVKNAYVSAVGAAQVSGIVDANRGSVVNCNVYGATLKGTIVAGIAVDNYGTISYDSTCPVAVNATLVGQTQVAGMVGWNYGSISGDKDSKTEIVAKLEWSKVANSAEFAKIKENIMFAGIACVSAGENSVVENFVVNVKIIDAVNAAGVVGVLGRNGNHYGGLIQNTIVNVSIDTIQGKLNESVYAGQTNRVGGVVALVPSSASTKAITINNVGGMISVNGSAENNKTYGLNTFGLFVAEANHDITIKSNDASKLSLVKFYSNYTSANTQKVGYVVGMMSNQTCVKVAGNIVIATPSSGITTAKDAIIIEK